jgi:hypothetical protein
MREESSGFPVAPTLGLNLNLLDSQRHCCVPSLISIPMIRLNTFSRSLLLFCMAVLGVALTLSPNPVKGQGHGNTSYGTDFWMGFMPDYTIQPDYIVIYVCSGTANKISVSEYGGGSGGPVQTFTQTLGPNQTWKVTLDIAKVMTSKTETPAYRAVHVTATNPCACYGFTNEYATSDGFLCLPTPILGTEFYTPNYFDDWYSSPTEPLAGEYLVVTPYDNTEVQITTTSDTRLDNLGQVIGHHSGDTWTVNMMKGQTYLVQSPGLDKSNDITGSHIISSKPIVLISGHERCSIPNDDPVYNSKDMLAEMIPSVDKWGTQYFDMPMEGRTLCGDYIRLLSAEDGNQIQINGGTSVFLNAGEYVEENFVLLPTVFTSVVNKKFVTMQYSYTQSINNDPGSADPFMITMTPQEQFQKELIFRTPKNPGTNGDYTHYATFIGLADSVMGIILDGKKLSSQGAVGPAIFLGTNPPMGATRVQLSAGENTHIATSGSPFGCYLYGFTQVDGYGWPAGMAMNIPSPDTLPPLQLGTSSCGDYTVEVIEPRHIPAFSFEDTRISSFSMITDSNDSRWPKKSYNYTFTPSATFQPGDSTATFTLNVINAKYDAYAAVYAVDRAGNDSVYEYTYTAPKYTISPTVPYSYGNITVANDSCTTFTITNTQKTGPLNFSNLRLLGSAFGGKFTATPTSIGPLNPGQSAQVSICYSPNDTGITSLDTIFFETGESLTSTCVPDTIPLTGLGVTPLIYADDVNFGAVDSGQTVCKGIKITNMGKATLTITKQDLLNTADFSVDPNQAFPIVLAPGKSITISYCFHPTTQGTFTTNAIFGTLNPVKFAHSIKDTSILIGVSAKAGVRLTSYNESAAATCGQQPLILDTVYNPEKNADVISTASISGPDAASFSIVSYTPNNPYPYVLAGDSAQFYVYTIKFDPTVKGMLAGPRTAYFSVLGQNNVQPIATLTASSKAPQLAVTPGTTTVDLGQTLINQNASGTFTVSNTGNDVLNIASIVGTGPDAANFTYAPQGPYTLQPGQSQVETVTFTAGSQARVYYDTAQVIPAGNTCATQGPQPLMARADSVGYQPLGVNYNTIFTCKTKNLVAMFINHSSQDTATVTSIDIQSTNGWTNTGDFQQVPPLTLGSGIKVPPGDTLFVPIQFAPAATGSRAAGLVFTYTTPKTDTIATAELQGIGANIAEVVGAGSTTTVSTYSGVANSVVQIPIVISTPFNTANTNEVYGYDFKLSWPQDAFNVGSSAMQSPSGSVTVSEVGTGTVDPVTHIETREYRGTSSSPLTAQTTLGTLSATVMLDTVSATAIVPSAIQFLDQNQQPLCYVASTGVNGTFNLQTLCGDPTIKSILGGSQLPLSITQVTPNPFQSVAHIGYQVGTKQANITVSVFDALGNEVARVLNNESRMRGTYTADFDAHTLSSGSYFVRVSDGTNTLTKEIVLTK